MRQILLQSVTCITKSDKKLLPSGTGTTKRGNYYKVICNSEDFLNHGTSTYELFHGFYENVVFRECISFTPAKYFLS